MTYNFKHIRLFENSPFKKISKSNRSVDDLAAVEKVGAKIIKENLSEKLYYILHLFYYHLYLIDRSRAIMPEPTLTGEKLLIKQYGPKVISGQADYFNLYYNRFCLKPPKEYSFYYKSYSFYKGLIYAKDNIKIKIESSGVYIKLPCIFDQKFHRSINILNPRNTMTIKDVYVNQLKYILQYGYKDKNVQKYYEFLLDDIEYFDEEKSNINISEIFNEIHEYLKYCSDNIDIKYVIADKWSNNKIDLCLVDIQSIDDVNESFLSIFENYSFVANIIKYVVMINSFVMSTDFAEVKKLLQQMSTSGTCTYLSSLVVSNETQLVKSFTSSLSHPIMIGVLNSVICENVTMYDHYELNDLSTVIQCVKENAFIHVGNPKKCSFRTDILNSLSNTDTLIGSYIKNNSVISKFDILKVLVSIGFYNDSATQKRINRVSSSERVKNNTNNDEYSKFIKSFEIVSVSLFHGKYAIKCDVVADGA